jgi:hypothetical protein
VQQRFYLRFAACKKCRNFTGEPPENSRTYFSMELNPNPEVRKKLKDLAKKEGISVNAMLVPFLNDIAAGRLVRSPHYVAPGHERKVA